MMKRAFVMPVVILLALVASLTVTVVLNRNSVRSYDAEFQLDSYVEEHRQRGIREVIAIWLQFTGQQDLETLIDSDGTAFSLEHSGNRTLQIRLFQSQSTALVNPSGLGPMQPETSVLSRDRQQHIVHATRQHLSNQNPTYVDQIGRQRGPLAVSLATAPRQVIRAMSAAVLEDEQLAETYSGLLVSLRDGRDEITLPKLLELARDAGVEDDDQTVISSLWTTTPMLWTVRAELIGPKGTRSNTVLARYEGLIFIPRETSTSPLMTGSEHSNSWFLEWNKVDDGVGYTPINGNDTDKGGPR